VGKVVINVKVDIGKHRKDKISVVNDFKKVHNDFYDYSLMDYKNNRIKIKIICPIHGVFKQTPHNYLDGKGCSKCYGNYKKNIDDIIKDFNIIHNHLYDYSLVDYKNNRTKIKIICKNHGVFIQSPKNHLKKQGCPKCNISKGESFIKTYLNSEEIIYEEQKMFDECKYKRKLKFDFYLPIQNICIEYDGKQHFEKYKFEKDNNVLNTRQIRDKIKTDYCQNNNIKLIRIKYNENINKKLEKIKTNLFI